MQVQLSKHTVELRDELNWGIHEELKAEGLSSFTITGNPNDIEKARSGGEARVMMNAEAIMAVKYKAARLLITDIKDSEGKSVAYSDQWLSNLSIADGTKLDDAITTIRATAQNAGK